MPNAEGVVVSQKPTGAVAPEAKPVTPPVDLSIPDKPATPPVETPPAVPTEVVSVEEIERLSAEFAEKGELSEESLKGLESKGIPRALTMRFVQSQEALQAQNAQAAMAEAGGPEKFAQVRDWASQNLNQAEKDSYAKALQSGDIEAIKVAVRGITAKYTEKNGSPPGVQVSGSKGPSGPAPFRTFYEMVEAQKNPRYEKDSAYRADVIERAKVSTF